MANFRELSQLQREAQLATKWSFAAYPERKRSPWSRCGGRYDAIPQEGLAETFVGRATGECSGAVNARLSCYSLLLQGGD